MRSILELLARRLSDAPDALYLDFPARAYSAADMDDEAGRAAAALADVGVGKGDRVATLLDNCPAGVSIWLGALRLGAVPVPINSANRGDFLRHPLTDSGARVVLVGTRYADRLAEVMDATPDLAAVLVHRDDAEHSAEHSAKHEAGSGTRADAGAPALGDTSTTAFRGVHVRSWDDVLSADPIALDPGVVAPGDLATLIYTAGTTGASKACSISHAYVVNACSRTAPVWGRTSADVLWTPLPLFHFAPYQHIVVGALAVGGSGGIGGRFSVSRFWDEIARTGATMTALLGSMTALLARAPGAAHEVDHRLRLVIAVPSPPEIVRIWRERFGVDTFSGGYALTEGGPFAIVAPGQANKPGAAGLAQTPDFDTRIFDEDDRQLPPGTVGEIVTRPRRAKVMFDGYWRRPAETVATMRNLWFHTGDLGRIDQDGFLYFVDRKKDYLRRRGENISSFEVESAFRRHDDVLDVAAHAVTSELGEDEVKVTVVRRPGATTSELELCQWSVSRLPYFAVPRYVEFRDELPRNPVGRVLKYVLRDEGVTPATWDREAAGFTFERY